MRSSQCVSHVDETIADAGDLSLRIVRVSTVKIAFGHKTAHAARRLGQYTRPHPERFAHRPLARLLEDELLSLGVVRTRHLAGNG